MEERIVFYKSQWMGLGTCILMVGRRAGEGGIDEVKKSIPDFSYVRTRVLPGAL